MQAEDWPGGRNGGSIMGGSFHLTKLLIKRGYSRFHSKPFFFIRRRPCPGFSHFLIDNSPGFIQPMLSVLSRNCKNKQRIFQIGSTHFPRRYTSEGNNNEPRLQSSLFSLAGPIESLLVRSRLITDQDAARLVAKTIALSTYSLAFISLLGTFGLDTSPLLTGIGITGFTVGFAVKEVATNLLSGAMLVMGKVVKKGMWVRLLVAAMPGIEGKVESVDVRNVVLKTKEGSRIVVPSVILFTNPLIILPEHSDGHQSPSQSSSPGTSQEITAIQEEQSEKRKSNVDNK
jgi:hypothetical protein